MSESDGLLSVNVAVPSVDGNVKYNTNVFCDIAMHLLVDYSCFFFNFPDSKLDL
jgi:hypothetical protein